MKDRLKLLRKTLGLNQVDFGARVGIGGTAISKFENGTNAISDSLVLLVCREFNVNENWLRNGNGEMFSRQSTDLIEQLTQQYSLGLYGQQLLATYLQLSDADKRAVERFVSQLTANHSRQPLRKLFYRRRRRMRKPFLKRKNFLPSSLLSSVAAAQVNKKNGSCASHKSRFSVA